LEDAVVKATWQTKLAWKTWLVHVFQCRL